jgi:hypothetical protein
LAQLIQSDSRCCAALPRSFAQRRTRARFRKILTKGWIDEDYYEVVDYRPRLPKAAARHKQRRAPLIALLLYATWIEHTVNALIIGSARIAQTFSGDIDDMARRVVAKDFPTRLSHEWSRHKAPPLDRIIKKRILRYMKLRNDLVHYKWIGLNPPS